MYCPDNGNFAEMHYHDYEIHYSAPRGETFGELTNAYYKATG